MGKESDGGEPPSPLAAVGPLLRLYSWLGAAPASMDREYRVFKINWFRYLSSLAVVGLCFGGLQLANYLSVDLNYDQDNSVATLLDRVFMGIYNKMSTFCLSFVIIINHRNIPQYTDVVSSFCKIDLPPSTNKKESGKRKRKYSSPILGLFVHHSMLLGLPIVGNLLMDLSYRLGGDYATKAYAEANSTWVVALHETSIALIMTMITIIESIPELVICRFQTHLSWQVRTILQQVQREEEEGDSKKPKSSRSADDLCQKLRYCLHAWKKVCGISGGSLLVLLSISSIQLLYSSYYFVLHYLSWARGTLQASTAVAALDATGNLVFAIASTKRIFYLSNSAQGVSDSFRAASDHLLELERRPETSTTEVQCTREVLDRSSSEGASVLGLFSVNRGIILVIVGQLMTYIVIMIEFKKEDEGGTLSSCPTCVEILNQTLANCTV